MKHDDGDKTVPRTHRFSELFASMVNHEMRNALNIVSTAANLLEMRADSEKIATPVHRISVSAARMERMLSQLVDFTRIELDGALVLIREPVELDELLQDLVSELPEAHRNRIVLQKVGDLESSWDRDRIKQAIGTLLANALQHGAQDGSVRVNVDAESSTGSVRDVAIEVESQGEIAPDVLEGLFVPKRRAPHAVAASGLGLGLFVAQHVAAAHGGALEVTSGQGRTRFTMRLPAQPAHASIPPAKVTAKHA